MHNDHIRLLCFHKVMGFALSSWMRKYRAKIRQMGRKMALNFNKTRWFEKYRKFRTESELPLKLPSAGVRMLDDTGLHNDLEQAIYFFLQPTGLLYGSLIELPFPVTNYPSSKYLDSVDRVYLIFLDSLFACLVADREFILEGLVEEESRFPPTVEVALSYFLKKQELAGSGTPGLLERIFNPRGGGNPEKQFEKTIKNMITKGSKLLSGPELFYNSFLFLDLYNCLLWQRQIVLEQEIDEELLVSLI